MEYHLPEGFKRIPRAADCYAVSSKGVVFNLKTGKKLTSRWNGHKFYTQILGKGGENMLFCADEMHRYEYTPLTKEWVLETAKAKVIHDYPDYAITSYGAVYIINPRSRGPRAHEVHMIQSTIHQGREKVYLSDPAKGKPQKLFRVDQLTEQLWGEESTYED
jgi:hypothetical protein